MRVQEILMTDGRTRYVVVDGDGEMVVPAVRFLKYLDSVGRARNTLRSYAHNLALFFEYLDQQKLDHREVTLDQMAEFVSWLKNPLRSSRLIPILPIEQARSSVTINHALSTVAGFYDYLWRNGDMPQDLNANLRENLVRGQRKFKSFLHHLSAGRPVQASLLRQKVRQAKPQTITKEEVEALVQAAGNPRDRLLLKLLFESSLRVGEALALWLEDVDTARCRITVCDRGEMVNGAEIKTPTSQRTVSVSRDLINEIMDYVSLAFTDEVETNHLFLKLRGPRAGEPMSYPEVNDLFRRIGHKTEIAVSAHVLRHSSATLLWRSGWPLEHLQMRLGHAHYQTTVNLYVHPNQEDMAQAWEQVEEALRLTGDDITKGANDVGQEVSE